MLYCGPILLHGNSREEAIKALPIENYPTKSAWNHLSFEDHRGIALPLISITSKNSSGCGEFLDLIPLIEWVKKSGLDLLQLLLIGDTGGVKSPYSPISSHALKPIYLSLASLPYLDEAPSYLIESLEKLKKNNLIKRVDYIKVLREKEEWLKKYLALFEKKLKKHPEYILFCQKEGNWLDDYACFKVLRQKYGPVIKNWPKRLKAVSSEDKERLYGKYKALISQQKLIQYLCFDQMHFVHLFADHHTVFFDGGYALYA